MISQPSLNCVYKRVLNTFNVEVAGLENISPDKTYVFAMNHLSALDPIIAYSVLVPHTRRNMNLFMSNRYYSFLWPLVRAFGAIKIQMVKSKRNNRHNNLQLLRAAQKIKSGNNILLYPEGSFYGGRFNKIIHAGTGAVRLAITSKTPIIPIGVTGTNKAYPYYIKNNYNPFIIKKDQPIKITIGQEISFQKYYSMNLDTYSDENKKNLRKLTDSLMITLAQLSGLERDDELTKIFRFLEFSSL